MCCDEGVTETPVIEKETAVIELAERNSNGLNVRLLWNQDSDELRLTVNDVNTGEAHEVLVDRTRGLDAFYHPFAYVAKR
ncbi:unannotated protein [freshwater metagenome]|uniref:Unannotated protein n=1 Tax=freshwater metagenome TaxID=449393 RepID=A0A6J6Q2G2_9ZZZZ